MIRKIKVRAVWDPEAGVWVATSQAVPGLATEADTIEGLLERLKVIIPELLELNGRLPGKEITFQLVSERTEIARVV